MCIFWLHPHETLNHDFSCSLHIWIPMSHCRLSCIQYQTYNFYIDLLWSPSAKLSARLDSDFVINLTLLMHFILYVIVLPFLFSFLIGTENVIYLSCFLLSTQTVRQVFLKLFEYQLVFIIIITICMVPSTIWLIFSEFIIFYWLISRAFRWLYDKPGKYWPYCMRQTWDN